MYVCVCAFIVGGGGGGGGLGVYLARCLFIDGEKVGMKISPMLFMCFNTVE